MQTENAVFGETREEQAAEVARILGVIAAQLTSDPWSRSGFHQTIFDLTGNDVGRYLFTPSATLAKQEEGEANERRRSAAVLQRAKKRFDV
jgi:hypothetical protein